MKRRFIYGLIAMVAMLMMEACTTNDGDIGFLGGHWRLELIEVDGAADEAYAGNITMAFQSNIVEISLLGDNHFRANYFGTFVREGDKLTLDYSHSSDQLQPGQGEFGLPDQLHLTAPATFIFSIGENPGKRMTLTTINQNNQTLKYTLSKIY